MRSRQLFASYSRIDREIVSRLCDLLRVGGTRIFRDEDSIPPGKRWKLVLTETLQKSECVLVFWSANSATSAAVREEYLTAIQFDKDIAPVLLDGTTLAEELRNYQWIDCRAFVKVKRTVQKTIEETKPTPQSIPGMEPQGLAAYALHPAIARILKEIIGTSRAHRDEFSQAIDDHISIDLMLASLNGESQDRLSELFAQRVFDNPRSD